MLSWNAFGENITINYLDDLYKRFKPKTAKRKIAALKAFTHYLMIQEIIDTNPYDKIYSSFREQMMIQKLFWWTSTVKFLQMHK